MKLEGKVLVLGSKGFLGQHLINLKTSLDIVGDARLEDWTNYENLQSLFSNRPPDYVINAAAKQGSMQFGKKYCADVFTTNTVLSLNVFKACIEFKVKKLANVLSSCGYPNLSDGICSEVDYMTYTAHPSVEANAWAKRNTVRAMRLFKQQHGLNSICVIPTTLFGKNDYLDLNKTKALMALVKRFVDAKNTNKPIVKLQGTGAAIREYIHVTDAAKLILWALENYEDTYWPINLAPFPSQDISIKNLAELIATKVGYQGDIIWDGDPKDDGQIRKTLDTRKLQWLNPSFKFTPFDQGLTNTIRWYQSLNV